MIAGIACNAWLWYRGMDATERIFIDFLVCFAGITAGSLFGRIMNGSPGDDRRRRLNAFYDAMKGEPVRWSHPRMFIGGVVALLGLGVFVAEALFEAHFPKPANILIVFGAMSTFVFGMYLLIPAVIGNETDDDREKGEEGADRSGVGRLFGSGWTWLAFYAGMALLMTVLYLVY